MGVAVLGFGRLGAIDGLRVAGVHRPRSIASGLRLTVAWFGRLGRVTRGPVQPGDASVFR